MLHAIAFLSSFAVVISGVYVLMHGEWRPFALKFAGVSLSTVAACWLLCIDIFFGSASMQCPANMPITECMTFEVYHVVRNLAFVIFHIAIGRDAIHYKKRDRRGSGRWMNSARQLRP